ncbi:uncharacterized protein LOC110453712 [Mizuhopecten yessoensis]|uniref:Adapter protein CIKS n=1 Tax=Mizuhopecten yessoensis TaxID=6573 RepID=A0A210QGX2_MIZYE|nr:uncharacterized protein LOC110453712 [Mizuhopecten yessoensis]OWF47967.1 Adapter protein CIKS [Mizuhopecten yessoensis]
MERPDALDVLLDAIPEIERKYTAAMRNNNRRVKIEPRENSCTFSSGCCTGSCGGSSVANSGISQHHHNISVCPSQYNHYNSQRCPDISSHSIHVTKELNTMPHSYQSYNSSTASVPHSAVHQQHTTSPYMTSYTSSSETDESMEVNIDVADRYLGDNIPIDNESESNSMPWPRDDKAPLPRTIFKAINYLPSLSRVPPLLNYNDMHVGNEEVVETSERMAVHPSAPFGRQVSEEMNTNQPLVDPKGMPAPANANLGLNLHVRPKEGQKAPVDKKKFCSPSPTTVNPLAKLQQFTNSQSYMPNEEYNSIMAAKNREEMLYNRSNLEEVQCRLRGGSDQGVGHREPQTEEDFRMIFNFNAGFRNHRAMLEQHQQIQNQRIMKDKPAINKEIPKTFPRSKSMMQCTSTVGGAQGNRTAECVSGLTKSVSMPDDMKPVEYQRKNFWHIKVFVTYSNDSKRHIQRVLNLCRCMEKNGFTCCMDVYDHKMDSHNKLGWVNQRFSEADFVLVCVSPNYLTEATCMAENNESALHTAYVYQLMESEIQNGGAEIETRFIPIMFDGSRPEDIPKLMHHRLSYHWPKQYRDLLWYLTKPETRTKTKANNYVEQCPRSPKSPNIPT